MDSLIGLIIFGVIAALSGLVKLIEKRKEEALREQRGSRQNVDELPEATRRMLYGDGGPPVARRREEGGATPPVAAPRRESAPPPPPPRRPVPQQRAETRPTVPPQPRPVPQQQSRPQPRPVAQPQAQRRPAPVAASRPAQQFQPAQTQVQVLPEGVTRQSTTQPVAVEPPPRRRRQPSIKALLHHPKTLRTSIMLHEVLGPPKSMQ